MMPVDGSRAMPVAAKVGDADGPRRGRSRGPLAVEYRVCGGGSVDDLRRREAELERLIVKAACHRAARLVGGGGTEGTAAGGVPPLIRASDNRPHALGAR